MSIIVQVGQSVARAGLVGPVAAVVMWPHGRWLTMPQMYNLLAQQMVLELRKHDAASMQFASSVDKEVARRLVL
jgi:hypothetical protein